MPNKNPNEQKQSESKPESPLIPPEFVAPSVQTDKEQPQSENRTTHTEQKINVAQPRPFVVWMQTWLPIIFNGLIFLAIASQVYIFTMQWKALVSQLNVMQGQLEETKKSITLTEQVISHTIENFRLEQRAWIGIKAMRMVSFEINKAPATEVVITNTGKTFAREVIVIATMIMRNRQVDISKERHKPLNESPGIGILPPNFDFRMPIESNNVLTEDQFRKVNSKEAFVYIFGDITYWDIFKNPHRTRFCGRYDPTIQDFFLCHEYNSAD